ncbi:hypothetical protein KFL_005900080 [Klebsormidium nitens]|uniref:Regucalcin n=1 Tax=Klebsormidium nitens TaxID=105231 RepID=A0A1Y1IIU2_KLENI|nr:hypothetical protein KFL_005900080 [Klebsormidium nitens]|eukprot:GAQ90022.1 hypothetical protein KFL_005900080 [Klebsormidium nitens]
MAKVELALDSKCILGECPISEASGKVHFVDINKKLIHTLDPSSDDHEIIETPEFVGCIVPRAGKGLLAGLQHTIVHVDTMVSKLGDVVARVPEGNAKEHFRFNDGKVDPAGRFWVGHMNLHWRDPTVAKGKLYCLDPAKKDDGLVVKLNDTVLSNGLCWSSDKRSFFWVDTSLQKAYHFDYDLESGDISNQKVCVDVPEDFGLPDGMTIDSNDKLWIAIGESGHVAQYDPETGKELQRVKLPVKRPTSLEFGGKDLSELYVTTREEPGKNPSPHAGGLFRAHIPGVKGLAHSFEYAG